MSKDLNPEKARIFRITHRSNVRWILENGLHCANSGRIDPTFVSIGNADLIERRRHRALPAPFGGVLGDYVPFYFTPFSPMMFNIRTGWGDITKRPNEEIVILVSSLWRLQEEGVQVVFSDRHAYLEAAEFYDDPARLDRIDWDLLQRKDFKRDPNDPGKLERYEAEVLARGHVPVRALLGLVCYNESAHASIVADMQAADVKVKSIVNHRWYFQ
jgi:hypothetical protein